MRAYNKPGRDAHGRWCRLTFFGKSTQGAEHRSRKARRYPGAIRVIEQKGGREPLREPLMVVDDQPVSEATVTMLETLERHAYHQITMCIDELQLADARQIVELLKDVGII